MNIYHNSQFLSKLKNFVLKQDNQFVCRLIGIALEEDARGAIEVYPVYRSIGIHHYPGQLILSLPWFKKELLVSLSRRGVETITADADQLRRSDAGKEKK